jgi:prevent-host-death family protein
MATVVSLRRARTHLSRLIRQAESGEEMVIARGGKPVARLVAIKPSRRRALGRDRGRFMVPDDFNEPLGPSILGLG